MIAAMSATLRIEYLADHPEILPTLRRWFETEWRSYYGPDGPGDAGNDLAAYAGRERLPIGLVAFEGEWLRGVAALKADSIATHPHLLPWAAAGLVDPLCRGRGIGGALLRALESLARLMEYTHIFCGTGSAGTLLERQGWFCMEKIRYHGENLSIYQKEL